MRCKLIKRINEDKIDPDILKIREEKMGSDYLTLSIPENLAREWFRAVGAEIVVRCRDCKHYKFTNEYAFGIPEKGCELTGFNDIDEDDFCSRGCKR